MIPIKKTDLENKTVALIPGKHNSWRLKTPSREGLAQLSKCLMSPTKDTYIPIDRVQCPRTRIEMYTKY